ncbi:MAG: leucine/isoleucine/valine transporter permease subunit [bacterium]|nr:leucine/isoleucine/valine transporter permease subunit [bacterium]
MTGFDLRRSLRWGSIAGAVMVFTCAVGLFEAFEDRLLVYPFLSLGHVLLLWFLPLAGYQATNEPVLEGMEAPSKGLHNVVAGLVAGLAGGIVMGVFTVVVDALDVRDVFVRLSVRLVDLLTHGWGVPGGLVLIVAVPALLGMAGGMLHLVSASARRRLILALEWALVVALLEQVFSQVLRQIRLGAVGDIIFTRRALEWWAALAVAALVALLSERARGGVGRIRGYLFAADAARRTRNSIWSALAVLAFLIVLPQLLGSLLSELLANVGLFLLMGLGLNIVVGLAGMLDLGYVAFFAVGAYTVGVLTSPISPRFDLEWSWWAALPVAILMSVVAGVLVGTPVIRMRGDYLAIVTLGFGEIVRILFLSDWLAPTFGGAQGVRNVPGIPVGVAEIRGSQPVGVLYFAFGLVLVAAWVSWALQESRLGRAWTAIREDETVAAAMGINVVRAKLNAFIVGAILAGLGGALFAAKVGSIFPSSFELLVSIIVLVVVIVGGMGNIPGVAVGAVLLIGVLGGPTQPGLLAEFAEFKLLIYGALLVFMMLRKPEGLLPSVRRSRELRGEELSQDAWLDRPSGDVEVDARLAGG